MIKIEDRRALADISIIIKMMSEEMKNKINPKFIKFVEENKDPDYISEINKTIPLEMQSLNKNTEIFLGLIYRDYICSPEERKSLIAIEKEEFQKIEEEKTKKFKINFNEKKQKEINEKHNFDSIIKSDEKMYKNNNATKSVAMVEYKESIFDKIVRKIKSFFKKH